jgi:hypothetical protein
MEYGADVTDHDVSRTDDGLVRKRYGRVEQDPHTREWTALRILQEYAPGLAPEPISADLEATPPEITMSVLPGEPLGGRPLSWAEMTAITKALHHLHTCVPEAVLTAAWPIVGDAREVVDRITSRLAAEPRPNDDELVARAYDDSLRWLRGSEANSLVNAEPGPAVLARGDHNLRNFLWDGDCVRLVDFEYAGRSDRCAEIAELVEHISARCTPDPAWQGFIDQLDLSRAERQRLLTIRRLLAAMWLHMLLPGQPAEHRNPPGTLQLQAQRMLALWGS